MSDLLFFESDVSHLIELFKVDKPSGFSYLNSVGGFSTFKKCSNGIALSYDFVFYKFNGKSYFRLSLTVDTRNYSALFFESDFSFIQGLVKKFFSLYE